MPLATMSLLVLASNQVDAENTSRPTLSGIHRVPYPQGSTRLANAAASTAEKTSVAAQTPSFFRFMGWSTAFDCWSHCARAYAARLPRRAPAVRGLPGEKRCRDIVRR